jgi:hypothetical protein
MKYTFFLAALLSLATFASKRSDAQSTPPQSTSQLPKLPYVAVHNPEFISVSQVNFMRPDDRLIGIMVGKVAKAYPAGILAQHGLVEDGTPDGPIAITW